MYKQVQIEFQPAFVPAISETEADRWHISTYFIRGLFRRGYLSSTRFYSRLSRLEIDGAIRGLSVFSLGGVDARDLVFVFDAPGCLEIIKLIAALNRACITGNCPALPDLEFVHPAAHALLYSLGGFSGGSADCYLNADPNAVDLNQKVLVGSVAVLPVVTFNADPNAVDLNQKVR